MRFQQFSQALFLIQFCYFFFFNHISSYHFHWSLLVVQSLSHVWPFVTPWTAACHAPLSSIISQSLLKFMSIESVMLSNHLIFCCPFSFYLQSFEASGPFPVSQLFTSGGQRSGASALVLPWIFRVQFSCSVMSDSLWPHGLQHTRPPCPPPTPWVHSNSCPLSQWCHPTISSSVIFFSSCPQSFPASGSFPRSQLFTSKVLEQGCKMIDSFM